VFVVERIREKKERAMILSLATPDDLKHEIEKKHRRCTEEEAGLENLL